VDRSPRESHILIERETFIAGPFCGRGISVSRSG